MRGGLIGFGLGLNGVKFKPDLGASLGVTCIASLRKIAWDFVRPTGDLFGTADNGLVVGSIPTAGAN